jgi:hypothetical protein
VTEGKVKFCPRCGSANLEFSELAGGNATCGNCHWVGSTDDLFMVPFCHDFFSDEGMVRGLMNDLRVMLSGELGVPYLKFLVKWGFVKSTNGVADRVAFTRYLVAIAKALLVAVFEERKRLSVEAAAQPQGADNAN